MDILKQAFCIWGAEPAEEDSCYSFRKEFSYIADGRKTILYIAADSTFIVWINGVRCPITQLLDFPEYRMFSELDITSYLHEGGNVIAVEVQYIGGKFLTYSPGQAFLSAMILQGDSIIVKTDNTWSFARSLPWQAGKKILATGQLRYVYCYNACNETNWQLPEYETDNRWSNTVVLENIQNWQMSLRNVPVLSELKKLTATIVQTGYLFRSKEDEVFAKSNYRDYMTSVVQPDYFQDFDSSQQIDGYYRTNYKLDPEKPYHFTFKPIPPDRDHANGYYIILDMGKETVGYLTFDITAPAGTVVDISHGEHLADGRVRVNINGGLNFTDRYICKEGRNEFTYYHRRLGGRYLELHFTQAGDGVIGLRYVGLIPVELPLPPAANFRNQDRLLRKINDVSIDTLKLCMHDHYEDCPWREQGLYAYDSRNQMLYGYYVWGNYDFAAASIDLLGRSFDGERYLALTAPCASKQTIPIFTLVWIIEILEQYMHSGSPALFQRWQKQIETILDAALADKDVNDDGLYSPGTNENYWNFCEWTGQLSGLNKYPQAPYNIYLCESLRAAAAMSRLQNNMEKAAVWQAKADALAQRIHEVFFDAANECYQAVKDGDDPFIYEHVQAIMLAGNLVPAEQLPVILNTLCRKKKDTMRKVDLSALYYFITALMKQEDGDLHAYLLEYLRELFEPMILSGATSLWETRQGAADFGGCASLCHAWGAAMPYFCGRYLLGVKPLEPGFKRFSVKPYPGDYESAEGEVPTPYGMIRVSWKKSPAGLNVHVEHPAGLEMEPEQYKDSPVAAFTATVR